MPSPSLSVHTNLFVDALSSNLLTSQSTSGLCHTAIIARGIQQVCVMLILLQLKIERFTHHSPDFQLSLDVTSFEHRCVVHKFT